IGIAAQVDEELRSDRFFRIITVSAQVYMLQENSSEWRELSPCPVLVHLYNDGIENVPKLLAEHQKEMIIDCCPLLPSFAVHCPSKKFMHVTSNKYDPHSPVLGFGFSNAFELETLFLHLRRLKATTASSMAAAAAVAAAGASYAAHPAAAALLASPRRTMGSPRLPSTPSHHHINASATPFSPRFHAAAAYKDSPYHGRHHSHPTAIPPTFHPAAAAAVAAAHLQQQQQTHHGIFGQPPPQPPTHGNNGYSFQEFVPSRRRREMSSLSMDRISCGQPPLNTMMMMNEMRSGVTSINGSVQGDETAEESLQPYFGYGEGDGGFGGLEDAPLGGGYEELDRGSVDSIIHNGGDPMREYGSYGARKGMIETEEDGDRTLGEEQFAVVGGRQQKHHQRKVHHIDEDEYGQAAPLPCSLLEEAPAQRTSIRDLHSMSADPDACSTPIHKQPPMMLLPEENGRAPLSYDDVFFSPQKHFSNFVLGCDLRPPGIPRAEGGCQESSSSPSLTTLISHFTPLSMDTPTSATALAASAAPFPSVFGHNNNINREKLPSTPSSLSRSPPGLDGDSDIAVGESSAANPAGVIGSPVKGRGGSRPSSHSSVPF
ncbi:hypothetical protein PMAYCL1PPCAC_06159, partial [Pristionchus mayeri]